MSISPSYMKSFVSLLLIVCLQVLSGCSDKQSSLDGPTPVPSAVKSPPHETQAAPVNTKIEQTVPASISGYPFELGGKCTVDSINDQGQVEVSTAARFSSLFIVGWAFDEKSATVPDAPVLQLVNGNQRYYAPLIRRGQRDDLSKTFGNPSFSQAGYSATVDIADLPVAQYDILIMQKVLDKILVCPTYRKLAVKA